MNISQKLGVKWYMFRQNIQNRVNEKLKRMLPTLSERGGIEQWITILIICGVVILIGLLVWNYMDQGEDNVIFRWFRENIEKITNLDPGEDQ